MRFIRHEEALTNTMFAGTHARGGANSFLWISEWGTFQANDLARSEEVLTGALPSVGDGTCVIETTWRGGRHGHLWSLVKAALEIPEEQKGPLDWRVVFFPWTTSRLLRCDSASAQRGDTAIFAATPDTIPGQKSWYQRKRAELGMFIKREYPTMLEECFQAPVEGAIYAEQIDKLRAEGAIRPWIVDNSSLTDTCWTLARRSIRWSGISSWGKDEIRVVDCDMDLDLTPVERVARMLTKGYLYGSHFLPHDALATQKSGRTFSVS